MLSPLSLFTHAPSPEITFEPTLFVPAFSSGNFSDQLTGTLSQLETTNASFFSAYAWLSSSPVFRLLGAPLSSSSGFYQSLAPLSLTRMFAPEETIASGAIFTDSYAFSPVSHLLPTRALPSLSFSGNKFYLIHRHLVAQQSSSANDFFSIFSQSALPAHLPRGFFATEHNPSIVDTSNLVSSFVLKGALGSHFDNTGWGLISFEDLGLTNAAASKALVSGGMGAGRARTSPLTSVFTPSSSVFTSTQPVPFSTDLGSDWASAWLLSLRSNTQVLGLINFFLTAAKSTSSLLGAQAYFTGINNLGSLNPNSSVSSLLCAQPSWSDFICSLGNAPHHIFFGASPLPGASTGFVFAPFILNLANLTGIEFLPFTSLQPIQISENLTLPSAKVLTLEFSFG